MKWLYVKMLPSAAGVDLTELSDAITQAQLSDAPHDTVLEARRKLQFVRWAQLSRSGKLQLNKWQAVMRDARRIAQTPEHLEVHCALLRQIIAKADREHGRLKPPLRSLYGKGTEHLSEKLQQAEGAQEALQLVLLFTSPTDHLRAQIEFYDEGQSRSFDLEVSAVVLMYVAYPWKLSVCFPPP